MSAFAVLEEAERRRAAGREDGRRDALDRAERALSRMVERFAIREAYLFGSVLRPGRFGDHSDIDLAVAGLGHRYWTFASEFSQAVGREVDVVELEHSRFAERIRREGRRCSAQP